MSRRTLLLVTLAALAAGVAWQGWVGSAASETLGLASGGDIVSFDDVANEHFTALAVSRDDGAPSDRPLLVRIRVVGEHPDLAGAEAWLADRAGVVVARSEEGVPVVFVDGDLATKRGNEALGATIPRGIAIETRDEDLVPCVFAHEILHFLGLHHVDDDADLMHPRCETHKPASATLSREALDHLGRVESVTALTLGGREVWAERT